MTPQESIKELRSVADSIPPGTNPGGTFIGQETINGNTYRYFKDAAGKVTYTSSLTDAIHLEMQKHKRKAGKQCYYK